MSETPTAYSHYMIMHECDRCGQHASNFTEIYNPRTKAVKTYYLCDACQAKLCATVALFTEGDY